MIRVGRVAVFLVAVVGCRGVPTPHYYVLEPQHVAVPAAAAAGLSIGVMPFDVDTPYDQDRIVYRVREDAPEVGYYAYHRWASPLSRMLPRVVAGAFADLSGISLIEPAASGRSYDATLRGRLLSLEEVDSPDGVGIRLVLTLTLATADGRLLWSETLDDRGSPRADREVSEVVARIRTTLNELLDTSKTSLERRLRETGTDLFIAPRK